MFLELFSSFGVHNTGISIPVHSSLFQRFHRDEPSTFEVEPWCVKLFKQRWYLFGKSEGYDELRTYALDRIKKIKMAERTFKLPKTFDAEKFFTDYYGIITTDENFDVEPVALKVEAKQSNYFRTLPLHHSQVEVERNEEYSIFEYCLCPTFDFRQKILSLGNAVSVIAPQELACRIRNDGYEIAQVNSSAERMDYEFIVYKD